VVQAFERGQGGAAVDFPNQIDEDDIELFMNECRLAGYEVEYYLSNKPAMEYKIFGDETDLLFAGLRGRPVYWYLWSPKEKVYMRHPS
jgi:hypothetical protein